MSHENPIEKHDEPNSEENNSKNQFIIFQCNP